tara:strand:+ start:165 stop:725 length:561 start_codon:yes stop_codon:yes gene_type:complete
MKIFCGDWYADSAIMYKILDDIDFYRSGRTGAIMDGIPTNGRSMMWGVSWRMPCKKYTQLEGTKLHYTKCRENNPHLAEVFKEYIDLYFKGFPYSQVQMNKNFPCPPHIDGTNTGESILVGYGEYTGGEINIEKEDGIVKKDIRKEKGIIFNGALYRHYVSPFTLKEGSNRYSLVFFKSKYHKKNC